MAAANGSVGFLTFAAWVFSVLAAVMAIDMYALLRTGEFGRSWRVLIIASVILALTLAVHLVELAHVGGLANDNLSQIGGLMFVMTLAYAIYLQRQVFARAGKMRRRAADNEADVAALSLRRDFFAPHTAPAAAGTSTETSPTVGVSADPLDPTPSLNRDDRDDQDDADIEWSRPLPSRGR